MNNSGASESTEIAYEASNTQHTSGNATSKGNYDQTVQDIENQNMQVVTVEVEQPIVIGTSFNQQQDPVQDIENPNLEEFDGAPPNFVQQQHIVEDIDPNQNRKDLGARSTGKETCDAIDSMYRAALEGDWAKAENLLKKDPTLAYKERHCYLPEKETEGKWYRPLHVAVALKHDKFARKLIKMMNPKELEMGNSNDLTACSYAAASGKLNKEQCCMCWLDRIYQQLPPGNRQ